MLLDGHVSDVQVSQALIGEVVTGFAISRVVAGEAELLTIALDPETRGRASRSRFWPRMRRMCAAPAGKCCFSKWLRTMRPRSRFIAAWVFAKSVAARPIIPANRAASAAMR